MFNRANLKILSWCDRNTELDDLPNPMWQPPTSDQIMDRCEDRRFENDLELILTTSSVESTNNPRETTLASQILAYTRTPPKWWFAYQETRNLSWLTRQRLWWSLLSTLAHGEGQIPSIPKPAIRRLARIGAILPNQLSPETYKWVSEPLHEFMDIPETKPAVNLHETPIPNLLTSLLSRRQVHQQQRVMQIMRRLSKAQD